MSDLGAPTGPRGMARTALVVGVIAAAVVVLGCEKKSDADAGKAPESATSQAQPAEQPAKPAEAPAASAEKPTQVAEAPAGCVKSPGLEKTAHMKPFDVKHPYTHFCDGSWDFRTWRGYNMYHSICHVCHGANALGSSFAPALKDSLKVMSYEDFVATVMNGRVNITPGTTNVMPSFGENPTVTKYIDSLYAYLKARADGAFGLEIPNWAGPRLDPVEK